MNFKTPYYFIDESKLLKNLEIIKYVREHSGARSVLALKCFSTWSVFGLMKKYMDGTTSSSLFETRLGYEKFGKEVHAYSVAYSKEEILQIKRYADKIIFNSISQLKMFGKFVGNIPVGIRINPGISYSHFDLADPARRYSRLGVSDKKNLMKNISGISGLMFHFNCENADYKNFSSNLDLLEYKYKDLLARIKWVSLGGGIYFTKPDYPIDKFCARLKRFKEKFGINVYLEPGETAITQSAELVTTVLDIVHNEIDIAIVDASTEAHMLDLLIYRTPAKMALSVKGKYKYMIAGRSCLAGDILGTYRLNYRLKPGDVIRLSDAAGYTMVKKNWFNGLQMPSLIVKRLSGNIEIVRNFDYKDYIKNLS